MSVKPSRPGEELLGSDFVGVEVLSWFSQLRRLQSLKHAVLSGKDSPAAIEHTAFRFGGLYERLQDSLLGL